MRTFTFGEPTILACRNGTIKEIPDRIGKHRGCIETIIVQHVASRNASLLRVTEKLNDEQRK
jgi:hypothetical protein